MDTLYHGRHGWMQGQALVGKRHVLRRTVDIKMWWLILYLLPGSMSPREAAPHGIAVRLS